MDEKYNHTNAEILKKKHESDKKTKIDYTMLSFTSSILPAAEGCHPNITIGPRSNKDPAMAYNKIRVSCWGGGKSCTVCSDVTGYNCLIAPAFFNGYKKI